jgi:hypothetical protein
LRLASIGVAETTSKALSSTFAFTYSKADATQRQTQESIGTTTRKRHCGFGNVCELRIHDFNNQNAILDLQFEDAGTHPLGLGLRAYRVTLQPAYGIGGSFLCGSIEVSDIALGAPPGSVYSE